MIPHDKLDATFKAAIDGCRRRTVQHHDLATRGKLHGRVRNQEELEWLQLVQGNYRSLIQVNTDLPIYADRARPGLP